MTRFILLFVIIFSNILLSFTFAVDKNYLNDHKYLMMPNREKTLSFAEPDFNELKNKICDSVKWEIEGTSNGAPAIYKDYVFADLNNDMRCIDIKTGNMKWQFSTGNKIYSKPVIYDNKVIFAGVDSKIYSLDIFTGKLLWKFVTGWSIKKIFYFIKI